MRTVLFVTAVLLSGSLITIAPPPASAAIPPDLPDIPGLDAMAAEVLEAGETPEERAQVLDTLRWIADNPDAVARELAPGDRSWGKGAKEEPFTILRTDDRSKPVLLVHGRDNYDMAGYASLKSYLQGAGYATVRRVGYYGGECNVELQAANQGSHSSWYGGSGEHSSYTGCNGVAGAQVHDLHTDIMHMSFHLAWMIHNTYGASAVTVDALGHSMGGLMLRYAIAKSGTGTPWPAKLRVEDVVTFGTPHGGLGTSWCKLSPWADVRQMCSDNSFIVWMKNNAQNPQGNGGTDWTVVGSDCDGWVAWNLAVDMGVAHKVVYVSPCYGHSDYYTDVSTASDATTDYMDAPATTWSRWSSSPHSARWANNAFVYGTW